MSVVTKVKNIQVTSHYEGAILSIAIENSEGQRCVTNFDLEQFQDIQELGALISALRCHAESNEMRVFEKVTNLLEKQLKA
jgi:hypothetical protein